MNCTRWVRVAVVGTPRRIQFSLKHSFWGGNPDDSHPALASFNSDQQPQGGERMQPWAQTACGQASNSATGAWRGAASSRALHRFQRLTARLRSRVLSKLRPWEFYRKLVKRWVEKRETTKPQRGERLQRASLGVAEAYGVIS